MSDEKRPEGTTLALQFEERMMLSMLLAQSEGNAVLLGGVRRIREKMSPSEEETEALGVFTTPNGQVAWNSEADKPVDFRFEPIIREHIVFLLKRADENKGLTLPQLTLFEKFVEVVEEPASNEDPA